MDQHSLIFTRAVGRTVVDRNGRKLGRVVAVVHRHSSADVLVQSGWLRKRMFRIACDDLSVTEYDQLVAERVEIKGGHNPLAGHRGPHGASEVRR